MLTGYNNEEELGEGIKKSEIPREKLFITTKLEAEISPDTNAAFATSLKKLQLEYVDLYLIHTPYFATTDKELQQKWREMEAIYESGLVRAIGVSNFTVSHLKAVLATAKVTPAINQVELHPYLQHSKLLEFHKENNIATGAYAPLTAITKASPGPVDQIYDKLSRKYGVTPSEIALRWCVDQKIVALSTSGNEGRLKGYLSIANFKLTPSEIEEISTTGKEKNFRGFFSTKFEENDFQ